MGKGGGEGGIKGERRNGKDRRRKGEGRGRGKRGGRRERGRVVGGCVEERRGWGGDEVWSRK